MVLELVFKPIFKIQIKVMMFSDSSSTSRYSDQELAEFKVHIEQKIESAQQQLKLTQDRIENISEMSDNDGDWMDDTSNSQDLELLYSMVNRQKKHLRDLENALVRIANKRYGVCVITGELIDKRRLMAVPTTTKSVAAKTIGKIKKNKTEEEEVKKSKPSNSPTSFSRVIKRTGGTPKPKPYKEIDEYDESLDFIDFEGNLKNTQDIDLDENETDTSL